MAVNATIGRRRRPHEGQGGQRFRADPQGRGHSVGQLLSDQPREQRARRRGRPHPDDGRGALRRRGRGRVLAGDAGQADRRVHGHGRPQCGRHPDGVRRHRAGVGRLLAGARHRGRRRRRRHAPHALRHGRGVQAGDQVGRRDRPRGAGARLPAPRLHASALRPPGPRAAADPARPRGVRHRRASLHAGEGLALRSRSGRRDGSGEGLAGC